MLEFAGRQVETFLKLRCLTTGFEHEKEKEKENPKNDAFRMPVVAASKITPRIGIGIESPTTQVT